jgi:hypothetical protein
VKWVNKKRSFFDQSLTALIEGDAKNQLTLRTSYRLEIP